MGVIRPPWITKEWFSRCPFNYCDHFGDKEHLLKEFFTDEILEYEEFGYDEFGG